MRRIVTIFFLILISQNLFGSDNQEFRATWVITWELIDGGKSAEQNKALDRQILDNHQKANMNAVLWQCRQSGTAYYNSSYEPWGYYAGSNDPGYDPLAYAVEEAHKRGMELHAWFNAFQASSTVPGAPAAVHPEWICRDRDGNPMTSSICLSPGLEAVRDYTIQVAMEIVNNYDIDGLHLDYVRWNEYSNSALSKKLAKAAEQQPLLDGIITEAQIQDLVENSAGRYLYDIEHPYSAGVPTGFSSWEDWWRWSVTEFVRVLHDSIQSVKPWVRLSPAALGKYNWSDWQGYGTVYQDAALWFNEGYIDQLTPMHYHWTTGSEFYGMLVGDSPDCWFDYIQDGINAGRLFSAGPGSSYLAEDRVWYRHPEIVATVRTIPWVDGFQFFSYGSWQDYQYWDEAGATFFKNKTKIRPTKLIVSNPPEAPTIALTKIDSLNYQIQVVPPVSVTIDQRYAIYRSTDADFDLNNDEIIDIHFGKNSYTYQDHFTGLQDHNGEYFYTATVLDRFWNESDISNIVQSEPVPSFAPTVIATDPVAGDTIPVYRPIWIYFSKSMDPTSLLNALSFTPNIDIDQLNWSDGNKSLTIKTKLNFQDVTSYILTIGTSATDVNGKAIDGNGDGIGGDAFYLHFRTKDIGPAVIYSYPDFQSEIDSFDIEDVISFVFDELIDQNTVYDSTLVLFKNAESIITQTMVTEYSDKSIINMKAHEPLLPDTEYSLLLRNTITDTAGNSMASSIHLNFKTSVEHYEEINVIDKFTSIENWKQPDYSGSTSGIVVSGTAFGTSKYIYLPASATRPIDRRSAYLTYQWIEIPPPEGYLLREYLSTGPPRDVEFDITYTLQCYVYGDGSRNKFRFTIDEGDGINWPNHEVSQWITIDWYGWKLLEWKLSDPNSVGQWIGNGILDGSAYRIDSFQLTHDNTGAISGKIYFDNLRVVKKSLLPVSVKDDHPQVVSSFQLYQNYPNPFNPFTMIVFNVPKQGKVTLKIFDILGKSVATLIDENLEAGHHEIQFDGTKLASGIYFYRLEFDGQIKNRQMLLMK